MQPSQGVNYTTMHDPNPLGVFEMMQNEFDFCRQHVKNVQNSWLNKKVSFTLPYNNIWKYFRLMTSFFQKMTQNGTKIWVKMI